MEVIRFRRLHQERWEIAFNEAHLFDKLDGEMAEIIIPAKPWYVRLWRRVFPLRPINMLEEWRNMDTDIAVIEFCYGSSSQWTVWAYVGPDRSGGATWPNELIGITGVRIRYLNREEDEKDD